MDKGNKIPCTLIPQNGLNILIPNSGVAEVIKNEISPATGDSSPSLLGMTHWQKEEIPVFAANSRIKLSSVDAQKHIIVIVKDPEMNRFMGFYASNAPRSTNASQHSLTDDASPDYINSYASRYIIIDHQKAIIPNLPLCFSSIYQ